MSDRPTPRTDEAERKWIAWGLRCIEASSRGSHLDSDDPAPPKPWEVARDLERKLAEARDALEWAQSQLGKHTRPSPIDKALASVNGKGTT